ncbi:MAG: hypothetical protein AAGD01_13865 [Acidobacteriota bacterium]
MKLATSLLGVTALVLLTLAVAPAAPTADAFNFVYCSQCWGEPSSTECYGACDGRRYYGTCGDYLNNCLYRIAQQEDSKEIFLDSLQQQVPEEAPAKSEENAQAAEVTQQLPVASD